MASEIVIDMLEVTQDAHETNINDMPDSKALVTPTDMTDSNSCCNTPPSSIVSVDSEQVTTATNETRKAVNTLNRRKPCSGSSLDTANSYASNKNVAEGLMDIALLSANANQLRFLITYNHEATTYYFSLGLVILSLVLQVVVGIALIFKRRLKRDNGNRRYTRTNELLIVGVFMVTVVNILLAAFTTTDEP